MKTTYFVYNELRKHCSDELLNIVGKIKPHDEEENTWDITDVIKKGEHLYEQMRVAYAFEQLGGVLVYEGLETPFVIISKKLNESICDKIRLFWIHNEENGVMPIYDAGIICVPPILPKYTYRPTEGGGFIIEKLTRGEYVPIKGEFFFLEQIAKERAEQLNSEE